MRRRRRQARIRGFPLKAREPPAPRSAPERLGEELTVDWFDEVVHGTALHGGCRRFQVGFAHHQNARQAETLLAS